MLLNCSCIDMHTHAFDFLPQAWVWNIDCIHMVHHCLCRLFETRYFPNSSIVISSPSVFFSLFVINFQHSYRCSFGNYNFSVEHCFNWVLPVWQLVALLCAHLTSWLCDDIDTHVWRVDRWRVNRVTTWLWDELTGSHPPHIIISQDTV